MIMIHLGFVSTLFLISINLVYSIYIIDLTSTHDASIILSTQICTGIINRQASSNTMAYTLLDAEDSLWLTLTVPDTVPRVDISPTDFITLCINQVVQGRYIHYDPTINNTSTNLIKAVLPLAITLSGQLDALLLSQAQVNEYVHHPLILESLTQVYDINTEWGTKYTSPWEATEYMYLNYLSNCTGLAKMNPGYDISKGPLNEYPPLTKQADLGLVDFIVSKRLFNFYLVWGCLPLSQENKLMQLIATNNTFHKPITVYGYDDTFTLFGGDLFEAETTCIPEHNMGQVASSGVNNLSFFSQKKGLNFKGSLSQAINRMNNPNPQTIVYNNDTTYVSIIVGDGDNINFVKGSRFNWFQQRLANCSQAQLNDPNHSKLIKKICAPLLWSISPHLTQLAPDIINWYYNMSTLLSGDTFVLPPSGHLYAYPSLMTSDNMAHFVQDTENDARLLDTSGSVAWELALSWDNALKNYFPLYSANNIVNGFFTVNVPYLIPVFAFGENEFFKVLGIYKNIVVFRPREWRGSSNAKDYFLKPAKDLANEINNYPKGTVCNLYVTSDGGASLNDIHDLLNELNENVIVVDEQQIVKLALQKSNGL